MFYTYMHSRGDTGQPFYIGKGQKKRAWSHRSRSPHWLRIVRKHGHSITVLARWATEQEAFEHEQFLIQCMRSIGAPLVNLTDGGEGSSGRAMSADAKARLSKLRLGKPLSDAHRAAIGRGATGRVVGQCERELKRAAKLGTTKSAEEVAGYLPALRAAMARPEVRAKIAAAAKNRVVSEETRARMSAARVGIRPSPESLAKRSASMKAALAEKKLKGN